MNSNYLFISIGNRTIILIVLFFLFYNDTFSQKKVTGIVSDSLSNVPIANANILFKTDSGELIDYAITDVNGKFMKEIDDTFSELKIETSIITHKKKIKDLKFQRNVDRYTVNFLFSTRVNELEEILIQGKKRPITVKKDTTTYRIENFKDGSERVVEDILKKLPGITVSPNGSIKFKGKQVSRLLLDNDNIFDSNYSIGTKNISADIIVGVQAFEDYDDNPLLKGVKSSDKVALNLKLKKGKADVSGNAELGVGIDDRQLAKLNALAISKKIKAFSILSYNNIGENYSAYNVQSNNLDISRLSELSQRSPNLLNDNRFSSILPNELTNINDNFFGSLNGLLKLNLKTTLRLNYAVYSDLIKRNEETNILNIIDNDSIQIDVNSEFETNPLINTINYELKHKFNDKELLTSKGKLETITINNSSNGLNNSISFLNNSNSSDVFLTNFIEYTKRFNTKSVFQTSLTTSINDLPQDLSVLNNNNTIGQDAKFRKNVIDFNSKYLKNFNGNELSVDIGYNFSEDFVESNLAGITSNNASTFNDLYYRIQKPYLNVNFLYRVKKWSFNTKINNEFYNVGLIDANPNRNIDFTTYVVYPSFSVRRKLSTNSQAYFDYSLTNNIPNVRNVFSGLILTDNRSLSNNDFQFNLLNTNNFNFGYSINDFYNLFQFNIYSGYTFNKFGFIPQLEITEDETFSTSILDVTNNRNFFLGLRTEKYINFLKSTINFNTNYSLNKFQNIVNNSNLRDNESANWTSSFDIRTGFKGSINFRNKTVFNLNSFSTEKTPSNSFTSFQNDFSIKYIKKRFQFIVDSQYFNPNISQNIGGDFFLDANLSLTSKNEKVRYNFRMNNLLNNKIYRSVNTSDFSSTIFQYNLQERFFLFSANFKF